MLNKKKISLILSIFLLLFLTACDTPSFGDKVEKEYYTGGKVRSTFTWSDSTGKNGIKKTYGFDGKLTSTVNITNAVPNGIMTMYDEKGRVIKQTPYVNGKIHGIEKSFYPNGDIMISVKYENNIKNGLAYTYYPSGKVCRTAKFVNNRLVN